MMFHMMSGHDCSSDVLEDYPRLSKKVSQENSMIFHDSR